MKTKLIILLLIIGSKLSASQKETEKSLSLIQRVNQGIWSAMFTTQDYSKIETYLENNAPLILQNASGNTMKEKFKNACLKIDQEIIKLHCMAKINCFFFIERKNNYFNIHFSHIDDSQILLFRNKKIIKEDKENKIRDITSLLPGIWIKPIIKKYKKWQLAGDEDCLICANDETHTIIKNTSLEDCFSSQQGLTESLSTKIYNRVLDEAKNKNYDHTTIEMFIVDVQATINTLNYFKPKPNISNELKNNQLDAQLLTDIQPNEQTTRISSVTKEKNEPVTITTIQNMTPTDIVTDNTSANNECTPIIESITKENNEPITTNIKSDITNTQPPVITNIATEQSLTNNEQDTIIKNLKTENDKSIRTTNIESDLTGTQPIIKSSNTIKTQSTSNIVSKVKSFLCRHYILCGFSLTTLLGLIYYHKLTLLINFLLVY